MIAFQHKLPVGVQGTGVSSPIYGLYKYVLLIRKCCSYSQTGYKNHP